jgi:hypothetical protein
MRVVGSEQNRVDFNIDSQNTRAPRESRPMLSVRRSRGSARAWSDRGMTRCLYIVVVASIAMGSAVGAAEPPRSPTTKKAGAPALPARASAEQRQRTRGLADKLAAALSMASPSASAIAAVLDAPLQYSGVGFRDACKKKFAPKGTVAKARLAELAGCLATSTIGICDVLIEDEPTPDFSDMMPPPCVMRLVAGTSGRRLITQIRVEDVESGSVNGSEPDAPNDAPSSGPPPPPPPASKKAPPPAKSK